jgi:hypothetical protein
LGQSSQHMMAVKPAHHGCMQWLRALVARTRALVVSVLQVAVGACAAIGLAVGSNGIVANASKSAVTGVDILAARRASWPDAIDAVTTLIVVLVHLAGAARQGVGVVLVVFRTFCRAHQPLSLADIRTGLTVCCLLACLASLPSSQLSRLPVQATCKHGTHRSQRCRCTRHWRRGQQPSRCKYQKSQARQWLRRPCRWSR